jgi:hypothetical protein
MKKMLILLAGMMLLSCTFKVIPSKWANKTAYTKVGFYYEKGHHITTNYMRGFYVPPNSEIKVLMVAKTKANISVNGKQIQIINQEKHTALGMEAILDRMLSMTSVKPQMSDKFKINLKTGQPSLGMTKAEVITCIGYPPSHKTYDRSGPVWKYWWSRFDTRDLIFEGEILKRIHD